MVSGYIVIVGEKIVVGRGNDGVIRALPKPHVIGSCATAKRQLGGDHEEKDNEINKRDFPIEYRLQTSDLRKKEELDYMSAGQEPAGTTKPSDIESDDGQLRFSAAEIDQLVDRFPFIRVRAQLRALLRWDELEQYPSPVRKKKIISSLETKNAKSRDKQKAEAGGRKYEADRALGRLANPDYVAGQTDEFGRKPLWERMQNGEFTKNANRRH